MYKEKFCGLLPRETYNTEESNKTLGVFLFQSADVDVFDMPPAATYFYKSGELRSKVSIAALQHCNTGTLEKSKTVTLK